MRTLQEVKYKYDLYKNDIHYFYGDDGYIVWRRSTGDNIEILFIEVKEKGKGIATRMVSYMCHVEKPFHSVFVFRLKGNESAGHFYRHLGFEETEVKGIYKGDDAVLGVVNYETLCKNLSTK